MKTFAKTLIATAALAVATAGSANAHDTGTQNVVVKNTYDNVAVNTFGNCVVTKALAARGGCHALNQEARTVYFDFNSSALTAASRTKLDSVVASLKDAVSVESVDIVGYADMIGSDNYNQALSMRRAKAVKTYLARKGVAVGDTEVRGLGETSSVSDCADKTGGELRACLWRDRRVELEFNVMN